MATIELQFADGTSHRYENVPDSATPDQVQARAAKDFAGKAVKHIARNPGAVAPAPAPAAPAEEPGYFMPGSKTEALARGFSQGATLGFGDEIQAGIRRLGGLTGITDETRTYDQLRDEERGSNAAAAQANPGSYLAGNVAAALPSGAYGLGKTAAMSALKSGGIGAVQGLGTSNAEDVGGMAADAAKGAAIQGATAGTLTGVGNAIKAGTGALGVQAIKNAKLAPGGEAGSLSPASFAGAKPYFVDAAKAARAGTADATQMANLQRIAVPVATEGVGGAIKEGAKGVGREIVNAYKGKLGTGGSVAGVLAFGPAGLGVPAAVGAVKGVGKAVGSSAAKSLAAGNQGVIAGAYGQAANRGTNATVLALQNMSGQEARQVHDQVRAGIDEAVAAGRPAYAATFQALNNSPGYRIASDKVAAEPDAEDDEE